jgi:hypothetical protein
MPVMTATPAGMGDGFPDGALIAWFFDAVLDGFFQR